MGPDYIDYNLVLAQETGCPCEDCIIGKQFGSLKKSAGLPNVVFHSLRDSSTTYKLKLNKGDLRATQGDTGHARIDMIIDIYAHILDEDRKINAKKFQMAFYFNADMRPVEEKLREGSADAALEPDVLMQHWKLSPSLWSPLQKSLGNRLWHSLPKKCCVLKDTK